MDELSIYEQGAILMTIGQRMCKHDVCASMAVNNLDMNDADFMATQLKVEPKRVMQLLQDVQLGNIKLLDLL
jgi:hypothetical protein